MAVQKSRKTPSKRGMHRSHSALPLPAAFDFLQDRSMILTILLITPLGVEPMRCCFVSSRIGFIKNQG